jgi:hypothetical protein
MAARKDKTNTSGNIQPGEDARAKQLSSAASRSKNAEERRMTHPLAKEIITEDDRKEWIGMLNESSKHGDLNALKLLLQILKELPDIKQTIDLHTEDLSEEDRELLKAVRERYETT